MALCSIRLGLYPRGEVAGRLFPRGRPSHHMTLYKYGMLAWVWRGFIAPGLIMAAVFLAEFLASWNLWLLVGALALIAPSVFFGTVVVVRADRTNDNTLEVQTLLFYRRRIAIARLGSPVVRRKYEDVSGDFNAPRAWVPVKGGLPLYFDLLSQIPDQQAFLKAIGLSAAALRSAE